MMNGWEVLRVLLFLGAVAAVFTLSAGILARMALERARRRAPPRRRWPRRIVLGLGALGILCIAYGRFVEPRRLEVTRIELHSPKLTRPLRIAHISDLHCDPDPILEPRLPDAVAAERPDVIVFTGDAINSVEALPIFQECMRSLSNLAPVFAVRGNWCAWHFAGTDLYGGTGARELDAEAVELRPDVWIAGVSMGSEGRIAEALAHAPPEAFRVLLHHTPDLAESPPVRAADLYLAGHTHGGQVALPLFGALVTLSKFGKRYESGLHRIGESTHLYVNRGIGMEGGSAPRVRFCARPELTIFELLPE